MTSVGSEVRDSHALALPGSVNAHTHLYSGLAPMGMPAPTRTPVDFVDILKLVWWKLDRALDEASLRASARLYLAEALLAGTTTVVDHHESPSFIDGSLDVLAEEADRLGVRLYVTYGITERNGGLVEARRGLAECARFVKAAKFPHVRGFVGLHASFTVSDQGVREAGELARELGVPVHVHVAEAESDVADARRRGFEGPLERLIALGCLPAGSILAHGVWLGEASVRRAHEAGAWLVQNPRSNANNRVGYPGAIYASPRVAVGTDGFDADMAAEHRALGEEAARAHDVAGEVGLEARRNGGHRLAILLDPAADRDFVLGVPGQRPREVVVAGKTVVKDGKLLTADIDEVRAHAREQARRLWAKMAELGDA